MKGKKKGEMYKGGKGNTCRHAGAKAGAEQYAVQETIVVS
jgi:hypothetical protein